MRNQTVMLPPVTLIGEYLYVSTVVDRTSCVVAPS